MAYAGAGVRGAAATAPFFLGSCPVQSILWERGEQASVSTIFQDKKNNARVKQVGGHGGSEGFLLVQGNSGPPYYVSRKHLIPCDDEGNPDLEATAEIPDPEDTPEGIPDPKVGVIETRLNINTSSAEEIARRIPGIGYTTAKKIKQVQLSLPGEVFRNVEQVKEVGPRVNWDAVMKANLFFLG